MPDFIILCINRTVGSQKFVQLISDRNVAMVMHHFQKLHIGVIAFNKNTYIWLGNLMVLCALHSNVYQQRDLGTRRDAAFLKSLKPEVSTEV
jgi:hypothetical protein